MKTVKEINDFIAKYKKIDSHVHTHLCDGSEDMTVKNIACRATELGLDAIILTPHFHVEVRDETKTLYYNTNEEIFLKLREEIDHYKKTDGSIRFLLSSEVDILSADGDLSIKISSEAEKALDVITPTVNFHPQLPLKFVGLSQGRVVDGLHEGREFSEAAQKIGGIEKVLEGLYSAEINAIKKCDYPSILGHFFAAHSVYPHKYTWFNAKKEHLPLMKEYTLELIETCRVKGAAMDLTGVQMLEGDTVSDKMAKNGFMVDFQCFTVDSCKQNGVNFAFGSDAHSLSAIASPFDYYNAL